MERKLKNRLKIKKHGPWTTKFSIEDKLEIRLKINMDKYNLFIPRT